MATENDQNVFASPWNDSDIVLVVEDQELHVHKWILTSQSPVFKAMFDGHFQEANQDKITLKEKDLQSMIQFLKLLYPTSMFLESKTPLNNKSRLSVMSLADEYQCVNLIKQCIDEAEITPGNVLQILPYALKYSDTELPRIYEVINWGAPSSKLEETLATLENKEILIKILLTKCRFLESSVVDMQETLFTVLDIYFDKTKDSKTYIYTASRKDSRCGHTVRIRGIKEAKSCPHCKEKYQEEFLAPIRRISLDTQRCFNMLLRATEIATEVEKQRK